MPVDIDAPEPSIATPPRAETVTSPPLPEVNVTPWISPPWEIERPPVLTIIRPAFPVPKLALEAMPLKEPGVPAPSMTSLPEAFTNTSPAAPAPNVEVDITPLFRIDTLSAVTII
jgi:hypothetical protein